MGSAKTGRIVNPELVLVGLRQIPRKPTRRGERRAALVRAAAAPVSVAWVLFRLRPRPVRFAPSSSVGAGYWSHRCQEG